ncbi:MAG: pitrilysin family protein [Flavobacteriia bacterium]|nr:pitrilysin family protein [Flavobacteriia bacterium]
MIKRKNAPSLKAIEKINFISPVKIQLGEHTPFFWMKEVPNETARLDFIFHAGTTRGSNLISSLVAGLLFAGTDKKTATDIHNELDDLGAFFDVGLGHESVLVSFYALKKNILAVFKIFENALEHVNFPQNEINELITDRKQKLKINCEKVGFLAQREFQKNLFHGTNYARQTELEDYDTVRREEIIEYFSKNYKNGLRKVVLVGALEEVQVTEIAEKSKKWCIPEKPLFENNFNNNKGVFQLEKKDAVQSAVRIGKTLFNKNNSDFLGFSILNTILGDYFGSRLMKNIREDKGYTYGISSTEAELAKSGYFMIGTEVGSAQKDLAIQEIKNEIERLQKDLVPDEELELVRNYLLGQLLKSADGPYAMTDLFLSVDAYELDFSFYESYIQKVKNIDVEELRALAVKYLAWDSMTIVIAG